ncbi:DUF6541 family protein [Microbacterium sp. CIAB417]|uniref:DUF6541 family protein n=1 Tax=Microbacterium sp. CIAB417 TaxID=2860287 RepID=UPI001FAD8566|nr:DUF6541 family protein [Microbacterium sp. CIAB417]
MIGDWLAQTPALLAAILVVFVPGVLALWGVGLRGLALLAAAPVFGVAVVGVTALVFGALGIPWSPLSWGGAALVLVVVAWVLGRLFGNRLPPAESRGATWILPVALAIGALFGIWRLAAYISDPTALSQTNDAVFHMNAVRFALETADASSLHINAVIGGRSFYPAAWHGVVSLVVMLTGSQITVAVNMLTLVIGAFIWPLGIAWLTKQITGSITISAYAAVFSGAMQAFPLLMFQWGVLFPNALSTALIPAGIAIVMSLPRWNRNTDRVRAGFRTLLLVLLVMAALLLSQPAALLPWAAICAVWLTFHLLGGSSGVSRRVAIISVVATWVALVGVWAYLAQGTSGSHWGPFRGKLEAVLDVILNGQVTLPFAYGVSVLMLLGLVVAVRRASYRWFVVAWLGISGLYVLVAAVGNPFIREHVLGAWYADPYRIAALAPIVVIPLAAIGFDAIVRWAARLWRGTATPPKASVVSAIALIVAVLGMLVLVLLRSVAMPQYMDRTFELDSRYAADPERFGYLDPDERALLESLGEYVPEGERVIGNPGTGSGFGYVLSGYDVFPRTWSPPNTEDWALIGESLRDAAEDPDVCDALETYGSPQYVLDFGPGEERAGRWLMPGMTDFAEQDGFELVAERGDASLWRITACAE